MPLAVRVLPSGGSHVSVAIDDGDGDEDKEQGGEGAHLANQYCVIYVEIRRWLRASGFGLRASGFWLRASVRIFLCEKKKEFGRFWRKRSLFLFGQDLGDVPYRTLPAVASNIRDI